MLVRYSLVGIYLCGKPLKDYGVHDHAGIVWDEFLASGFTHVVWRLRVVFYCVGFVAFSFI